MTRFIAPFVVAIAAAVALVVVFAPADARAPVKPPPAAPHVEAIYIRNLAPHYITDRQIRHDIPAWEHAVNVDFAGYWHTTPYRLIFTGRAKPPVGAISATFVDKGPVKGALAYHWLDANAPAITVYAGTGAYYGYSNSVSFTHELFELAADPVTSYLNVGYPSGYYWLERPNGNLKIGYANAVGWFSEVCDPVEADFYRIHGVPISDFVTPAWFNDGVGQRFDFMGVTQQPFWLRPGGYAQYLDVTGWNVVFNFRKGHPSDRGFYKSDPRGAR